MLRGLLVYLIETHLALEGYDRYIVVQEKQQRIYRYDFVSIWDNVLLRFQYAKENAHFPIDNERRHISVAASTNES